MDPKEAETQKKIKILAVYIRKQLAAGVAPQELYKDLITRKVPHKLAVKMINQSLAQADRTASQSTAQPEAQTARLEELRTLINTQADAGKTVNEIRNQLVEKKVAPEEAAVLILEVTGLAVQPLNDRPHVSPFLPNGSSPAVIPALENQKEMQAYIHTQLSAGVGLKVLVDALIQHGMDRNQAINLVMDLNQKREAELRETAPSPAGEL
ncbi:MAG: hypothetical protein JW757_03105, partial [Anaerolineales bacterium]|nr:hypothetical protein [Anaerolineales bacterium]